jgi:hypothetical protein
MTESRPPALWGQAAAHAAMHGRRVSVADVCAVAVSSAQLAGAWLAAARGNDPDFVMCVTDPVGEQLAELQLTLGEGPCHDVLASAAPVLAADLGDAESVRRWPGFTQAARQLGAGAVFAFPLIVGAIRAGVLGLYRGSPGPLPDRQLGDLLILADAATVLLHLLTDRSVRLLGASAAGVMLADPRGELRVAAASSEEAGLLELFQLQNDQGPCLECFRTGRPVTAADLTSQAQQWPRFAQAAAQAGFATVEALPMRLRDQVIGALNLFRAETGPFDLADLRIAQALADVATIGLLHQRNVRRRETVAEQLQAALNSRVVIEQAKGKLAERLSIDMDRAFTMLRDYARNTNQHLTDVARDFVTRGTAEFPPPARHQPGR